MNANIIRAGFLSSVQDLGRSGHFAQGVSLGGALDGNALAIANLLIGNDAAAAGIEFTLGEMRIGFGEECLVAWSGGAFDVRVGEDAIAVGRPAVIRAGEELRIAGPAGGMRGWLAVAGGIDVPLVLGSRATDLRAGFGGLEGRTLRDGDVLPLGASSAEAARILMKIGDTRSAPWTAPVEWASPAPRHPYLRIVPGAEWSSFHTRARNALVQEAFTVTPEADRMGIRLDGARLTRASKADLLSAPVAPGTIQVPPGGQPILLLGDCQTIGGYPKIAHVITVDLPSAAQLAPGGEVRFVEVTLPEAQRLLIERDRDLARFRIGLEMQLT